VKIQILNRWTNACLWEGDADDMREAVQEAVASRADLREADLSEADLSGADLSRADLREADLSRADLSRADLRGAHLSGANLSGADLRGAHLSGANLSEAYLREADLRGAHLSGANLMPIKADVWEILLHAIPEVPALAAALREGRVDGSTYRGPCACLCGTIANARQAELDEMPGITPDSSRPAERFFLAIRKGDTPANNAVSAVALEWVEEFQRLIQVAQRGKAQ